MSSQQWGPFAPSGGAASEPFRIKRNDTLPIFLGSITERDPTSPDPNARRPMDLTTVVTAWLFARTRDNKTRISGQCSIRTTDPSDPIWAQFPLLTPYPYQVTYAWQPGDTAKAATYNGEVELRFPGSAVQTVPGGGYFVIVVEEDQG